MGDVKMDLPNGSKHNTIILKDVVYTPELAFTLISVTWLDMAKCGVLFKNSTCTILYPDRKTMGMLPLLNGLYWLVAAKITDVGDHANFASVKMSINEAHHKFGHITHAVIKHMVNTGMITGIQLDPNQKPDFCEPCAKAKSNRKLFLKESTTRATEYGEWLHWDLWGPATVKSIAGNLYVAARLGDATCETKLHFQKEEVYIKMHTGWNIKYSHSDWGGEFLLQGTQRELTVHDSPPQNGVSERGMCTCAEQAQAMLISSGLPHYLWKEAMKHLSWLQNRSGTHALAGKTPMKQDMVRNQTLQESRNSVQQHMWKTLLLGNLTQELELVVLLDMILKAKATESIGRTNGQ
jgi:hypothetical protein